MAEVVAVIASTHHPSTGPAPPRVMPGPFADEWVAKSRDLPRDARARTRTFVMVGSDHHQLWLDNMPQFLIGKAPFYDANWYNEARVRFAPNEIDGERADSPPTCSVRDSTPASISPSATSCGSTTRSPAPSSPCGPRRTCRSCRSTPTSSLRHSPARSLRRAGSHHPPPRRELALRPAVAIIGTGHLSLELGGGSSARHGPDPEFDKAVDWIAKGDIEGCLAEVTLDSLHTPGNATHGFMDFMLMMGVAGDHVAADYVDTLDLFHTMEAYFTWYPKEAVS